MSPALTLEFCDDGGCGRLFDLSGSGPDKTVEISSPEKGTRLEEFVLWEEGCDMLTIV